MREREREREKIKCLRKHTCDLYSQYTDFAMSKSLALSFLRIRGRGSNLVPFRSVRVFRHPVALPLLSRRRDTRPTTHGRSKKTGRFINGSSTRTCEGARVLRRRCIPSLVPVWTTVMHTQCIHEKRQRGEEKKDRIRGRGMRQTGTRQRQPYLVLDMRTWTSDDKLSSSCLSSSARYAKAETGLLALEYFFTPGVRLTRKITFLNTAVYYNVFLTCTYRAKIVVVFIMMKCCFFLFLIFHISYTGLSLHPKIS